VLFGEGSAFARQLGSKARVSSQALDGSGKLIAAFGLDQQCAAGPLQDVARFAAHGANDWLACCQDFEEFRRNECFENRHVA
jgi:hypothetical protein